MSLEEKILIASVMVGYLIFLIYRNKEYFKKDK